MTAPGAEHAAPHGGLAEADLRAMLAELYPGRLALLLVGLCSPYRAHAHRGEPCESAGKVPPEKGWTRAAADRYERGEGRDAHLDLMARHLAQGGNVGWAVPEGVLVLDADAPEADTYLDRALPDAPAQESRRGRGHYVVKAPEGLTLRAAPRIALEEGVAVDLRVGGRSQIVAEPSVHPETGSPYTWLRQLPSDLAELPELPPRLVEALRRELEGVRAAQREPSANGSARIGQGERNGTLASLAGSMRRRGMEAEEIEAALAAVNARRCEPPLSASEVRGIAWSVGQYAPAQGAGGDAEEPARPLLTSLSDVPSERVEWLWPRRLPRGKVAVLDGDPGLGKSTLTLDLAARVSAGRPMPDGAPSVQGGVVIASAEDGLADTIRPRLDAAMADPSRIVAFEGVRAADGTRAPLTLPDDVALLERAIREVGALLVVIDPLMAFLGGDVNAHRDQHVRRALAPVAGIAEATGAAVLVVRHLNKAGGANAIYRGGGSIGIIGAARAGLLVAADPDDPERRVLAVTKSNLAEAAPALGFRLVSAESGVAAVDWLGETGHQGAELLAVPADGQRRTVLEDAKAFLREALAAGPRKPADLKREAKEAGVGERALEDAKHAVGVRSRKLGFSEGWVWQLETKAAAKSGGSSQPPQPSRPSQPWGHIRGLEEGSCQSGAQEREGREGPGKWEPGAAFEEELPW